MPRNRPWVWVLAAVVVVALVAGGACCGASTSSEAADDAARQAASRVAAALANGRRQRASRSPAPTARQPRRLTPTAAGSTGQAADVRERAVGDARRRLGARGHRGHPRRSAGTCTWSYDLPLTLRAGQRPVRRAGVPAAGAPGPQGRREAAAAPHGPSSRRHPRRRRQGAGVPRRRRRRRHPAQPHPGARCRRRSRRSPASWASTPHRSPSACRRPTPRPSSTSSRYGAATTTPCATSCDPSPARCSASASSRSHPPASSPAR